MKTVTSDLPAEATRNQLEQKNDIVWFLLQYMHSVGILANVDVNAHHMLILIGCLIAHDIKQLSWFVLSCQFITSLYSFLGGVIWPCLDSFFVVGQGTNFLPSLLLCSYPARWNPESLNSAITLQYKFTQISSQDGFLLPATETLTQLSDFSDKSRVNLYRRNRAKVCVQETPLIVENKLVSSC